MHTATVPCWNSGINVGTNVHEKRDKVTRWNQDPTFEDVERIAEKIEKAIAKANLALHKLAYIEPGEALKVFADAEGKFLNFDTHAQNHFEAALEEKKVRTLAHGDMVMTCVLSAAVALSEFKKQPHIVTPQKTSPLLAGIQKYSTTSFGLLAFSTLIFYSILGVGVSKHAQEAKSRYALRAIPITSKKK